MPHQRPAATHPEAHTLTTALLAAGRALETRGLIAGRAGNLSARTPDDLILATPAGTMKGQLTVDTLVWLRRDGTPHTPDQPRCSSEIAMHLAIYDAAPAARAVVHAHPRHATALGLQPAPLNLCITAEGAATLGPVARVPYLRPGTTTLGDACGRAALVSKVILLQHHGAVCWGESIEEALCLMDALEHVATIRLLAPDAPTLPDDEVHTLRQLSGALSGPAYVVECSVYDW